MLKWISLYIFCLFAIFAKAQTPTSFRSKIINTTSLSIQLDSLSIVPGSVSVLRTSTGILLDSSAYSIDYAKARFLWKAIGEIELKISYRVFPILFAKTYFHKDARLLEEQVIDNKKFFKYTPENQKNTLFDFDGLNKSGSISRGIMFGNNQNLSVNSNMVLQMAGKIGNGIEILAAISDDNLPIQPEGNTQQLNEFDRVFIQLKRDSTILTAGDYELKRPNSYFMNFYKRTQGAMLNHGFITKNGTRYSATLAAAVAKGRSARNIILGQEGNQGPYRLTGNNAETFVIVIAGTERVYIDGILLARGQDNDYIIDYNTAELTFTPMQLINQNTRISVEFEYTDKSYSRSLTYFNQQIDVKKASFRLNYYNEKDNKNQPFLQTLDDGQKQFLAGLGRSVDQAFYPNVTLVAFNANEILYEQLTAPTAGVYYRYSTDPLLAKYRLGFSYVGENRGNYQLNIQTAANGKVYEYVTPIAGLAQGAYEPITLLVTPKQLQMVTVATDFTPEKNTFLSSELAMSNNNLNLFAPQADGNLTGYALRLKAENRLQLNAAKLMLISNGNYEYVSQTFTPIERYRSVEFNRDFNLDGLLMPSSEHLVNTNVQLFQSEQKNISYGLNAFIRQQNYQGYQHRVAANYQIGKYRLKYNGSLLKSNATLNSGDFYKQYLDFNRRIFGVVAGFVFDQQYNETFDKASSNLTGNSLSWAIYQFYLQSKPAAQNKFKVDYSFRQDQLPRLTELLNSSTSRTINAGMDLTKNPNSLLSLTAGYRNTAYQNNFISTNQEENLVGRIDYNLKALKGFLNSSLFYEIGNGQEPKRDITYLEVLAGQGVYAWNDYNNNNIRELNEFEVSRFPDQARYIRVFTSTTDFVRTNFTAINQSIILQPSALLKANQGFAKLLAKFSNQSSYKIDRKILAGSGLEKYNPFDTAIEAANLISLSSFFRNTLFFNRNNPVYGFDLNYLADGSKIYLSNGFDTRSRSEMGLRFRSNLIKNINFNLTLNAGKKTYLSELFTQRNFLITYQEAFPEFNYQLNNDLRISFAGIYGLQKNREDYGGETNTKITLTTETRYNILKKGLLTGKISFINNNFVGNSNSTIGYEMLAGLQSGDNLTWGLGLQRNIGAGVQLNLNYEGRKSNQINVVHTGNMQVRAYF